MNCKLNINFIYIPKNDGEVWGINSYNKLKWGDGHKELENKQIYTTKIKIMFFNDNRMSNFWSCRKKAT